MTSTKTETLPVEHQAGPADESHYCCCLDHDLLFCGSPAEGGFAGVLETVTCVVCLDIQQSVRYVCPFGRGACPPVSP